MMEQLTLEDAERQWHIARLERSLAKWRERGTDQTLPDVYKRYCDTLAHLQAGGTYVVRDVTEEVVGHMGRLIHGAVMASDRARRRQLAERKAARQ